MSDKTIEEILSFCREKIHNQPNEDPKVLAFKTIIEYLETKSSALSKEESENKPPSSSPVKRSKGHGEVGE